MSRSGMVIFCILTALGTGCTSLVPIEERWDLVHWYNDASIPFAERGNIHPNLTGRIEGRPHVTSDGSHVLLEEKDRWEAIWKSVNKPVPNVDFSSHVIIGVVYSIPELRTLEAVQEMDIDRIEKRDGGLVVWIRKRILQPGLAGSPNNNGKAASYVMIKRIPLPLVFAEEPYWTMELDPAIIFHSDSKNGPAPSGEHPDWRIE